MSSEAKKSCSSCIFYADTSTASALLGGTTNTPICVKYSKPLGIPKKPPTEQTKLRQRVASGCPSFTETGSRPADMKPQPMLGLGIGVVDAPEPNNPDAVSTCRQCVFFIEPKESVERYGIGVGACARKGKLLVTSKLTAIAKACKDKSIGVAGTYSYDDITFSPEYQQAFGAPALVGVSTVASDPLSYPTDAPVTDKDKAEGVIAWRRIHHPDTDDPQLSVLLPIFGPHVFTEEQQSKIPKAGDEEHPELYLDHAGYVHAVSVLWRELDETPAIWGEAGVGKTELYRHMAYLMQLPFERFSITGSTELDDLAGKMHYTEGQGTHFKYGRLPLAWKSACVLCIDEPNVGPNEVWQFLRPLTDNSKQLVLDMNEGEAIARNDNAYLGMAMNPAWDPRNVGANVIGDADGSRLMHIFMDLPPAHVEAQIIKTRCSLDGFEISAAQLHSMQQTAETIRGMARDGTLTISWGLRNQIKVARALRWFGPTRAYRIGAGDMMAPQDQAALMNAVRAHFPDGDLR